MYTAVNECLLGIHMNDEKVREKLEELHLGLLQLSTADPSLQKKRDELATSIREALDQEDLGEYQFSIAEMLDEEILSFEKNHPNITIMMSGIKDMLSSLGI